MQKSVYIIPGYGESYLRQSGYKKVAKLFKAYGIIPIHVPVHWKKKGPEKFSDYARQFLKFYKKGNKEVYILGFSYGATIAFLTATKTKPKALILCSLPPYFKEDQKNLKPEWLRWWKKRFIESDYAFAKLAPKIKTPTYLLVGGKEHKSCLLRAKDAKKKMKKSRLVIAKGAEHKIGQKEYISALEKLIAKL